MFALASNSTSKSTHTSTSTLKSTPTLTSTPKKAKKVNKRKLKNDEEQEGNVFISYLTGLDFAYIKYLEGFPVRYLDKVFFNVCIILHNFQLTRMYMELEILDLYISKQKYDINSTL